MAAPGIVAGLTAAQRARDTEKPDAGAVVPLQSWSMSPEIYLENGKSAPFTVLLENLAFERGHDERYRWKEDALIPQSDTVDGSVLVGGLAVVVANIQQWTVNDVLWVRGQNAQGVVTGINQATNTLTIAWTHAPAAAILPNAAIHRIGNAYPQVSMVNIGPTTIAVDCSNIFQDLRHGVAASRQYYEGVFQIKPKDWDYQVMKKGEEHAREKEKTHLFGQQVLIVTGATAQGLQQGLFYFSATNQTAVNAALTRATLDTFLGSVMNQNEQPDQDWWLLASARIATQISQMANPLERTDTTKHRFGMGIGEYLAPTNEVVKIVTHPMFFQHGWNDLAILVNFERRNIYGLYHRNMETRLHRSIQPYGRSAIEEFYWTVQTLCFKRENINLGLLTNVTP